MKIRMTSLYHINDVFDMRNGVRPWDGTHIDVDVMELPTDIFGLTYEPRMVGHDNSDDAAFWKGCPMEVSIRNYDLMVELTKKYATDAIMEIGVSRNHEGSFCNAMFKNKPDNVPYVGIDIMDKSYLNDKSKNIYTLKESSFNQQSVRQYLNEIGVTKLSMLMIDGNHSVDAVINDWKYADLLTDNGVVIFHDTNFHAGPVVIIDAIDKTKFEVVKYFEINEDYGMSVAYKK